MLKIVLRVSLLLLLILGLAGCDYSNEKTDLDKATIESYARIKLPNSATNIHSYSTSGKDLLILVKFELPPSDLDAFTKSIGYTNQIQVNQLSLERADPFDKAPWWDPRAAKIFAGGMIDSGSFAKMILIDKTNPNSYIIYLEHSTV
jgi:hypothetical protein